MITVKNKDGLSKQVGFIKVNDGIKKEGENPLSFNSKNKRDVGYTIYGGTEQKTYSGKNLFYSNTTNDGVYEYANIKQIEGSSELILNKSTTTDGNISTITDIDLTLPAGTYTVSISGLTVFNTSTDRIALRSDTVTVVNNVMPNAPKTFTITEPTTITGVNFIFNSQSLYENQIVKIMIEAGSEATEYEPYVGGAPSPNPDYPQEVVGCGDRTRNLWKTFSSRVSSDVTIVHDGEKYLFSGTCNESINISLGAELDAGTYSLQANANRIPVENINSCIDVWIPSLNKLYNIKNEVATYKTITFSIDAPAECSLRIRLEKGVNYDGFELKPMLNSGSTPLPYEPYGYKVVVVTRGKNLLKLKDDYTVNVRDVTISIANGDLTLKGTATGNGGRTTYLSESFMLQAGTYTLRSIKKSGLVYCLTNTTNASAIIGSPTGGIFTLTEDTMVAFGVNVTQDTAYDTTVNVMLELGTEATEYEPYVEPTTYNIYHNKPIYSIGDYADYINNSTQKTEGKLVKELILTGEEEWRLQSINSNGIANFFITSTKTHTIATNLICTHFVSQKTTIANTTTEGIYNSVGNAIYIRIKQERASTVTDFKSYLAAQYEAGTPVKVYYVLAEPEVTEITEELPSITPIIGTNVISVDTTVSPSKLAIHRPDGEIACIKDATGGIIFEKGYRREECGVLPLQFNAMGVNLKDYTIYGGTYQQTYIGKNLVNIEPLDAAWGYNCTSLTEFLNTLDVGTYTISFKVKLITRNDTSDKSTYGIAIINDVSGASKWENWETSAVGTIKEYMVPFNINDGNKGKYTNSYFYGCGINGTGPTGSAQIYDIQLEVGNTATAYEPYVGGVSAPNANYPQEVHAVGDRTPNLFDKNDCTVVGYINADGNLATTTGSDWFTTENYIKCSGVITLSTSQGLGGTTYVACYDKQKNLLGTVLIGGGNPTQNTVTLVDGTEYIKTCARDNAFADYMLNEGDTALPYEPYGYKIPITTKGKNLIGIEPFEAAWVTGMITTGLLELLNRLNIGTYKMSYKTKLLTRTDVSDSSVYGMSIRNESKNYTYNPSWGSSVVGDIKDYSITINISETEVGKFTATYLYGCGTYADGATGSAQIYDFQLEYGDTATEYEPYTSTQFVTNAYLDKPIYKIGDYADTLGYREKLCERNIKELVLTGDENWQYNNTLSTSNAFYILLSNYVRADGFCSHYSTVADIRANEGIYFGVNINILTNLSDGLSTVDDFKSYLKSQYEAGTPVKVYYVLSEPTIETITLPDVPTLNGGNVLDVDTTVEPTLMSVVYKTEDPTPKPQALRTSNLEILTTADGTVLETRM